MIQEVNLTSYQYFKTNFHPIIYPSESKNGKLLIIKNSEKNTEILPLKKRYKYEVNDLQEIINGNAAVVSKAATNHSSEKLLKSSENLLNNSNTNNFAENKVISFPPSTPHHRQGVQNMSF